MQIIGDSLIYLILCGLLGVFGQSIRVLVGIKKEIDVHEKGSKISFSWFNLPELLISLLIAFPVGAVVGLSMSVMLNQSLNMMLTSVLKFPVDLLSVIASGYAGTDFIEGFMRKYTPETTK